MGLVEVYVANGDIEAYIVKSELESEGIVCSFKGHMVHSVHPYTVDGPGEVRILVPEKDVKRAKAIIERHKMLGQRRRKVKAICPSCGRRHRGIGTLCKYCGEDLEEK